MPKTLRSQSDTKAVLTGHYTTDYDIPGAHALVLEQLFNDPESTRTYASEAQEYLDWYEKMRFQKPIRFGQSDTVDDPFAPYRVQLIRRYLMLARKYVSENVIYDPPRQSTCLCGVDLGEMIYDLNGILVCPECGAERQRIGRKKTAASVGGEDIPSRWKQDNEERDNFVKALVRFQGLQKDRLPADLPARLDSYFCANNYPTGEQVRNGNVQNASILNKDIMYKALASVGCPMYEHINLICNKIWGWPLPELNGVYDTVLQHFDIMQRIARNKGLPTINTQYRLFKHLEMAGYPCYASDFRIPKTREIIQADEEHWRDMCEGVDVHERALGIRFIPTI
jgi:hypothetical protein